jgi:hypothetical protein
VKAPDTITVEGQPYSLQTGRHFLYFFDPECSHCYIAAKEMAKFQWKQAQVIVVPTVNPQFAPAFLEDSGLKARIAGDVEVLRNTFKFGDPPYAVAIENGRQTDSFIHFENGEPENSLRKAGYIQ